MDIGDTEITFAKIEVPIAREDSARVVSAVLDLFSPLTEMAATLGDHIRLYRARSVLGALAETKRLAEEAGVQLKQPPLKFLIPYMEEVSKEDPEDKELRSLWANLLLQAASDESKAHPLLVEILSKLTAKDAMYLEKIVRNPRYSSVSVNQIEDTAFTFDKWPPIDQIVDEAFEEAATEEEIVNRLIQEIENRGVIVTSCGFYSVELEGGVFDVAENYSEFPEREALSLHALAALGLVRYPFNVVRSYKGGTFILTICALTELGVEFYLSTHAPELRSAGSDLPPFERDADGEGCD